MNYAIFLDDIRSPKTATAPGGLEWFIARNYAEFFAIIEAQGAPSFVSFDHDLGEKEPTGYDIVKDWAERHMDGSLLFPVKFDYRVHSANPVGAENISQFLNNFQTYLEGYKMSNVDYELAGEFVEQYKSFLDKFPDCEDDSWYEPEYLDEYIEFAERYHEMNHDTKQHVQSVLKAYIG